MDVRDYLASIRRRSYVFFPVLFAVIGAHMLWVNYGQKGQFEASAQIGVQASNAPREQFGKISPAAWVRPPSPASVKASFEEPGVRERIAGLLAGNREFSLREFSRPPLEGEVAAAVAEFQEHYGANAIDKVSEMLRLEIDNVTGVVTLTTRAASKGSALAVAWASADAVVLHFRDRMEEDLGYLQDMLREESQDMRRELEQNEARWAKIIEEHGFDPISRQNRLERDIENLQSECDQLAAEHRELARRYRDLVQARPFVEGRPADLQAEKVLADNERIKALEKRIVALKLDRDEQLERRTASHPEVIQLDQRIQGLEERLPKIIQEELAKSVVRFNDREINDILFRSRTIALDRELKQEQIASLKRKVQELAAEALSLYPVKKACDDTRENYRVALAMANSAKFVGATSLFGNVRMLDPGRTAVRVPIRGQGTGPLILAAILALLAALAAVYVLEYIDTRVKDEQDVRRYLDLPLLGVLPRAELRELRQISNEGTRVVERFNTAATLVRTTARELNLHTFAVCSAVAQEGKTTVSVHLAAALARKGATVALVDADLRMPQVHRMLGLSNEHGLSTLLSGWVSPQQVIDGIVNEGATDGAGAVAEALQDTAVPGLRVLASGPSVQAPARLIESERFPSIIRQLAEIADFVILDTPPIDRVGDGLTVASIVDGCIFVVGAGQCEQRDVTWAKHLLTNVQANLLGAFLNRCDCRRMRETDYSSGGRRTGVGVHA